MRTWELELYGSERLLYAGSLVGAVGVGLLWTRVGGFWLGGIVTSVGCALMAAHYGLGAAQRPPGRGATPRRAIQLLAVLLVGLLGFGLLWLSALALLGQPLNGAARSVGNVLPLVGVAFGVCVVLDFALDRPDPDQRR